LNFLTPEGVVEAARLVQTGKVFRLDASIGFLRPPMFGRSQVAHRIVPLSPLANDDVLDGFNTQEGSQWDGLRHVAHPVHRVFYDGVQPQEIKSGPDGRLGIHRWAGQFVGRGVLIDAFGFRKARGRGVNPLQKDCYTLDELRNVLEAQGTALTPGSILLVRTGWLEAFEALPPGDRRAFSVFEKLQSIGVEASREMVAWLWN